MYRLGILGNTQRKLLYHPFVLGVAGDSATGKSTIVELLLKVLGVRNVLEIAGDDMHKWERGDPNWEKFTHLNPLANRLHDDMDHIARLKKNQVVRRRFYDHTTGRFTEPQRIAPKKMIVYQGLHALYLDRARSLIDLKIFLLPDEALRRQWKVDRDTAARGHTIERVLKQMDDRVEDAEKYIAKQREHADLTFSFTGSGDERMLQVLCSNSLPLDELIEVLNSVGLVTTHEHHEGKQLVTIKGVARADQIEMVAYGIVPWVWDINRERVTWESGLSGVMQLLILYAVTHNMQFEYGYTY